MHKDLIGSERLAKNGFEALGEEVLFFVVGHQHGEEARIPSLSDGVSGKKCSEGSDFSGWLSGDRMLSHTFLNDSGA